MDSFTYKSRNWSKSEKSILKQLVAKYASIVENKRCSAEFLKLKSDAWRKITNKINKLTHKNVTDTQVKVCWRNMKMRKCEEDLNLSIPELSNVKSNSCSSDDEYYEADRTREQNLVKRTTNWTAEEKNLLKGLVAGYADIVENKCITNHYVEKKNIAWKEITNKFNEMARRHMTDVQVRKAWCNMKTRERGPKSDDSKCFQNGDRPINMYAAVEKVEPDERSRSPQLAIKYDSDSSSDNFVGTPEEVFIDERNPALSVITKYIEMKQRIAESTLASKQKCAKMMEDIHTHKLITAKNEAIKSEIEIDILKLQREKLEMELELLKKQLS